MHVLLYNERNITVCCCFTQLHSNQILLKLVNIWPSYCENQTGEHFCYAQHSVFAVNFCLSLEKKPVHFLGCSSEIILDEELRPMSTGETWKWSKPTKREQIAKQESGATQQYLYS